MALSVFNDKSYFRDPFGLGIKRQIPENPKCTKEENDTYFTRSLLSEQEKKCLDEEGILSIENVRTLISENMVKAQESYEGVHGLDPDLLILIDSRIDYKIYIVDDNVYLFEELYTVYPFQEFNVTPESIMVRQDIGFFTNGETVVVDAGEDIIAVDDLVGLATKKNYILKNKPDKIVHSKIYVGKEKWKDFAQLHKFFRGIVRVSMMQIENSETPAFLKPFTQAFTSVASTNMLTDVATCINTATDVATFINTATNTATNIATNTATNTATDVATFLLELQEIKQIQKILSEKIQKIEEKYKIDN